MAKYETLEKSPISVEVEQVAAELKELERQFVNEIKSLKLKEDAELAEEDLKEFSEKLQAAYVKYDSKVEEIALTFYKWLESKFTSAAKESVAKYDHEKLEENRYETGDRQKHQSASSEPKEEMGTQNELPPEKLEETDKNIV